MNDPFESPAPPAVGAPTPDAAPAPAAAATSAAQGRIVGRVGSLLGSSVVGLLHPADDPDSLAGDVTIGALIKMKTPQSEVFGIVIGLRGNDTSTITQQAEGTFDIELMCEAMPDPDAVGGMRYQRGVSIYPALGSPIYMTTRDELAGIYARPATSNVRIGSLHQDREVPAFLLTDELLGKHFAVLGTTGSGKSCTVALILHAILAQHPNGRIIILDPHNEYTGAFEGMVEVVSPDTMQLPYWLLNFEETVSVMCSPSGADRESEIAILSGAILECKKRYFAEKGEKQFVTVDTPVPYRYGDLIKAIDDELGKLDKPDTSAPYLRLKSRLEGLRADRRYAFMFSGYVVTDTLPHVLSQLLRIPVDGKPVTVVDLSGVPSGIVDAMVSVLCRMIFDFALWCSKPQAAPVLLVCEEAHRYVPADHAGGFAPTRKSVSRIAKEGRKYGVSLCLVTQRPSELDMSILSQCNTVFSLRMGNERDLNYVRDALPEGSQWLLAALPSLRAQEGIIVGEGVTVSMRVRFDDLPPERQPRSSTANFSTAWQTDVDDPDLIEDTIEHWRKQIH